MFRTVSIIGFVITLVGIVAHCALFGPKRDDLFGKERRRILDVLRIPVLLLTLLLVEQRLSLLGVLKKLVYLLALFCFIVLLITGFYPVLILGEAISGYLMMVHATFAPVFAACLAFLVVMWAGRQAFGESDCPGWLHRFIKRVIRRKAVEEKPSTKESELGQKVTFWLIVALSLPAILSIVAGMFPLFGTGGQEFLLGLHRWSALVLALVIIVHIYLTALGRAKR